MRRFLKKTFLFIFGLFVIAVSLFIARYILTNSINWELPNDKHIIFMGASHIQAGINPSVYEGSINIASSSERYMFTFLKLNELIKANPQIDTVFLQFAPTDLHKNTDTKYFQKNEMLHFLPLYYPLFSKKEWGYYLKSSFETKNDFAEVLFKNLNLRIPKNMISFGGFSPLVGQFDRNTEPYNMPEWLVQGSTINDYYLNEIINLCKKNSIELFLIYMPMYNKNHFYDIVFFYKKYKEHFSSIPFEDYSDWNCPDYYRKDEHHLNKIGAIVFTKKLKKDFSSNTSSHNKLRVMR
jgi:hypothetical protein